MFASRFPVSPRSRAWLVVRVFRKSVLYVVPKPAEGTINITQGTVFATDRQKGRAPQQTDGEEPFCHVTAICSRSCLFRRIPA
jgi:hypothetical protein